ncbi:MAG: hypothetical protein HC945_00010 [Nitrosarchaeum sp.]|nr:hypothetical protein [Nitrosarchaeum sp.]
MWSWLSRFLGFDQWVFERVEVTSDVVDAIVELAHMTHPKEFVLFFEARKVGSALRIDGLVFQTYDASEDSAHFHIQLPTLTPLTGTVHSHPGYSNRPSDADLTLFRKHGLVHAIICMPYAASSLRFYDKHGGALPYSIVKEQTEDPHAIL